MLNANFVKGQSYKRKTRTNKRNQQQQNYFSDGKYVCV